MADRIVLAASSESESSHTGDTNWTTKVSGAHTPADNSKILYIGTLLLNCSSASTRVHSRLYNSTDAAEYAEMIMDERDTTDYISHHTFFVEEYGSSPGSKTIQLDYRLASSFATMYAKNAYLIGLELDANDSFTNDGAGTAVNSASYTTVASRAEVWESGEEYIAFLCCNMSSSSTAYDVLAKTVFDGVDYGEMQQDVNNINEFKPWATAFTFTGDGTSKSIDLQCSSELSGTNTVRDICIAVLKVADLEAFQSNESRSRATTTSTSYQDKASLTYTPANVRHLVIGCGIIDGSSTSLSNYAQLLEGASSKGEHLKEPDTGGEAGGAASYFTAYAATLAASSTTWKTQYKSESASTTTGLKESGVFVLQTETSGGGGTTGQIKVWNGSSWVAKPVKEWNGSSWVTKPLKHYNGSSWVTTPY